MCVCVCVCVYEAYETRERWAGSMEAKRGDVVRT